MIKLHLPAPLCALKTCARRYLRLPLHTAALVCALLAQPALAFEAQNYCGEEGVWIQILGSGGPELNDNTASASYLVWQDGKARVLIDPAPGSSLLFDLAQARYEDLEAVLISNLNVHHVGDLPAFIKGAQFADRTEPLRIFGPDGEAPYPGTTQFIERLIGPDGAFAYLAPSLEVKAMGKRIVPQDIPAKGRRVWARFGTETLQIAAVPVNHGSVPALAYRITMGDQTLVFSGNFNNEKDTLVAFAEGADALVLHHAIPESARGAARELDVRPSQIGRIASRIDPNFLILGHRTNRTRGVESLTRNAIEETYLGDVLFGSDLECWGL
ncbi:MAG: MBL fold metallo-hydrolase [Pseudomonadota bacterium]